MFVPLEKLPPQSKLWIYQADRKLSAEQKKLIGEKLREFTGQWLVHGEPLHASFDIRFDQFVVVAANDTASGCSIDSSVRVMKEIGALAGVDFFNRNLIAFKKGEEITLTNLTLLKSELQNGSWNEETPVFNNAISNLGDINDRWLVPAGATWLKRYIARPQSVQ